MNHVEISKKAKKDFKKIPEEAIRELLDQKIENLKNIDFDKVHKDIEKIKGTGKDLEKKGVILYRIRQGGYRILFGYHKETQLINVTEISPRGSAYKGKK